MTFSNDNTDHEAMDRMMESMGMVFEMKKEAKVAFKASALYFVVMVLSIVYNQNHVIIHAKYNRLIVLARIKNAIESFHLHAVRIVRKYRRRHYTNVQEVHGMSGGAGRTIGPGLGLAKVNINALSRSRSQSRDRLYHGDDSDSGLEELGLSMLERSRTNRKGKKKSSNITIDSGGEGEGLTSWGLPTLSHVLSKTKKG
eukprot:CAMPEP_0176489856 /NCGR_PEP_ID=MMETSP0200_2-20121128/7537_1 /TAXON_ID=947934 /ORGANISM="Chaetoceros sp., Strain GSL56" /LENGTH=198 /DNA_ID=CAMNT_0017887077 /DNA_START=576 /DNA_END=1172 /DNA_ORIENTATION=-